MTPGQLGFVQVLILFWRVSLLLAQQVNNQESGIGVTDESSSSSAYFYYQQPLYPRDCREVQDQCSSRNSSGIFLIKPDSYVEPFEVYCENGGDSEGWTVIQRRLDQDLSFARNWTEYKLGFGFLTKEFWLGNEKLSYLTHQKNFELRIDLTLSDGSSFYVNYGTFSIGDEFSNYNLANLGEYSGSADSFITWCQTNKAYGNCTCQRTCEDPYSCLNTCSEAEICICPDEYYLQEGSCIPREDCGCYVSAQVMLHEGEAYVNSDCARRAVCTNSLLSWDNSYACSYNAMCEERDDVRQCYCNPGYRGDGVECTAPTDCLDVYNAGFSNSGVYTITPSNWPGSQFEVYCNMADGGGWTVFQRRVNGGVDFFRNWDSYKEGFGSPDHEMWLGNDKIYYLTNQKRYKIRIDFVNRNSNPYYALFDNFQINDEADNYRLSQLGTYSGTADERSNPDGRFLRYHLNYAFTTYDRENDADTRHCAQNNHGAWWYYNCAYSNLNGDYHASEDSYESIFISDNPGPDHNIKFTEMKIRPF